uniref:Uncharacterized protein n=1 Tax=Glossina brevipalpis TaxID=37001 RepID=A0A1A9W430_9MUSC
MEKLIAMRRNQEEYKTFLQIDENRIGLFRKNFVSNAARVFLYLQPKEISYKADAHTSVTISLEHQKASVSKLKDFYKEDNVIYLHTFAEKKPTFSLPINRDNVDDIVAFSDSPLKLTLYETISPDSLRCSTEGSESTDIDIKTSPEDSMDIESLPKVAMAQGFLDLIPYFSKGRAHASVKIILYPLDPFWDTGGCTITWDIYSLMPLLKELKLSNIVFISFASLFNVATNVLEDCDDLIATLSWRLKDPKKQMIDKIFICRYTAFSKKIIDEQNVFYKWESLKDPKLNNYDSLGIYADVHCFMHELFSDLLCTENVDFNIKDIDITRDFALVCNSIHRFVLTDKMQIALESYLACDRYEILVEISKQSQPTMVLLQGSIDTSIFMYPKVTNCSFAIQLKPPEISRTYLSRLKSRKTERSFKVSNTETSVDEIPKQTTFAIINICLKLPITGPAESLNEIFSLRDIQRDIFNNCWKREPKKISTPLLEGRKCAESYKSFDDSILQIVRYLVQNNIQSITENKPFFCAQVKNVMNLILPLIACDFNIRYTTKTNIEFMNLVTIVHRELVGRCYNLVEKIAKNWSLDLDVQIILQEMNLVKLLYHIGNENMSQHLLDTLDEKYGHNPMFRFHMFLYDIEVENFDSAREYLNRPLKQKYMDALFAIDLCEIYLDYMKDIQNAKEEGESNVTENLLKALKHYCEKMQPKFPVGWMILYCIYKKHNYRPGMSYARWKYENLMEALVIEIHCIPKSRWEIYNNFRPNLKTERAKFFWKACEFLLQLGLYCFARWLFDDIANEFMEVERYIIDASLKLAVKLVATNFMLPVPLLEENEDNRFSKENELNAFLCLVNGNIEYYRNPYGDDAMKYYASLLNIIDVTKDLRFQLGILRYAYRMLEEKQLEEALEAFEFAREIIDYPVIAYIGKAEALYFLDRLKEAELYFAETTRFSMYLPNVWAYLAVINLRLGQNYRALECWKYAHLNSDVLINGEILNELEKFDVKDISFFVDV